MNREIEYITSTKRRSIAEQFVELHNQEQVKGFGELTKQRLNAIAILIFSGVYGKVSKGMNTATVKIPHFESKSGKDVEFTYSTFG